jgi:ElaB/YqjD/DUF883 family membrane-anchored ribosome-binding protein
MEGTNGQSGNMQTQAGARGYNDRREGSQNLGLGNGQGVNADLDRLAQDFRTFITDAEALLRNARTLSGEGAQYARVELSRRMEQARERLDDLRNVAGERAVQVRASTEDYVRREPFKAIAIAAAAGAFAALLMTRRS